MQKLVKLQSGRICNFWIPNGLPPGAIIIGDIIPGERGEWLVQNQDGSITIDQTIKDTILANEAANHTREQNEKNQILQIRSELRQLITDIQNASTAAEIKAVLIKIVKFIAFTNAR